LGAWSIGEKALDKAFGWVGRRRRRREDLIEATSRLSAFIQTLGGKVAMSAVVTGQSLNAEIDTWREVSGDVLGKAFSDPDPVIRQWGEELRKVIHEFSNALAFPISLPSTYEKIKKAGNHPPGEVVGGLLGRLDYLMIPWPKRAWTRLWAWRDGRKRESRTDDA
jgi:hypothetical protein